MSAGCKESPWPIRRAPLPAQLRLDVLRQHTRLGQLLDELEIAASELLADSSTAPTASALDTAIRSLHTRFTRHLDYEDEHLADTEVLGDHAEQRERVDALLHDRAIFTDSRTLAHEALVVVHRLRIDIDSEEARLNALFSAS